MKLILHVYRKKYIVKTRKGNLYNLHKQITTLFKKYTIKKLIYYFSNFLHIFI